jgi:hypothetical protein
MEISVRAAYSQPTWAESQTAVGVPANSTNSKGTYSGVQQGLARQATTNKAPLRILLLPLVCWFSLPEVELVSLAF